MVKALLIAEKPSLMRDIQKVYNQMNLPFEIDFASFVGHVVELKEPHEYKPEWKKWSLETIPMIPERYEFRVKKSAFKVYKEIEQKLKTNQYDFIINACDAGMEGENIFYSFYRKVRCKLPVKRFWTSQTTDRAIQNALANLIHENDVTIRNLRHAAMYRAIFDWLIGLNLTRIATVKGGRTIQIGRVMTPTLAIVVRRELEIQQFKPEPYFQVELDFGQFKALWFNQKTNDNKLKVKEVAEQIISEITDTAIVRHLNTERKTMVAPSLHSLLELQKEANKFYGFTSNETLKIAQSLYEKKLITYPRTESKHLPSQFAQTIESNIQVLKNVEPYSPFVDAILQNESTLDSIKKSKRYVDDKKLTDHHAITVTDVAIGRKKLSTDELKIYHLIAKRLLAIFLPPYVIDKTVVELQSRPHLFKARGNTVIDKGYTVLYESFNKKAQQPLPALTLNQEIPIKSTDILSKMTEPPPRFTDSSLLDAMYHAGRFVEDETLQKILRDAEGIGTSATRAEIIEKLIKIGMIARTGKSFKATQFGIDIILSLGTHDIVSPVLTAIWSKKLKDIVDGHIHSGQFYKEMLDFVHETTARLKNQQMNVDEQQVTVVGKCLECGQPVIEQFKGYCCTNSQCKFFISKQIMKGKITATDAKKLLSGRETREILFTWKSGKKGKAKLKFNGQKLEFVFTAKQK